MNYAAVKKVNIANGIGVRYCLFVSGCTNHCKNCFQPETWNFDYGYKFDKNVEDEIINDLKKDFYDGLTILGGEPFEFENQKGLIDLIIRMKKENPDKTIWIYTGFLYEDLLPGGCRYNSDTTDYILDNIDVLVDGKFVEDLKNPALKYKGSSNQRIIDIPTTRRKSFVVLHDLND